VISEALLDQEAFIAVL